MSNPPLAGRAPRARHQAEDAANGRHCPVALGGLEGARRLLRCCRHSACRTAGLLCCDLIGAAVSRAERLQPEQMAYAARPARWPAG